MGKFIVENWYLIISALSILVVAIIFVINFFKQPTSAQIQQVREWLLWAVCAAEKSLGSGTGKLKLRMVYDMFLEKFPYIASVMPFDKFSALVDEALEEMKKILSENKAIQTYIGVEPKTDTESAEAE